MEILHAFGIEWKLLVIQMLNFGVVLFVLQRFAYKPIMAIIEKREKEIAEGVAAAEHAKKEKERVATEGEHTLLAAREEGGKIVEELRKEGIEAERMILREAQEMSTSILTDAHTRAEEERAHLLRESEKEIAKMALLAAEKILRTKATQS
jgi:F-type H+-transporting ATPase subunit b